MPERATLRRILAFVALGLVVGLWLVARPSVLALWPMGALVEFPIALVVVALLLWLAARPARARERPEAPWRRHEQVVRPLPDPETAPLERALDAWVDGGKDPDRAADVLARALEMDDDRRAAARQRLLQDMGAATNRRKREALVRRVLETPDPLLTFDPVTHERTGA